MLLGSRLHFRPFVHDEHQYDDELVLRLVRSLKVVRNSDPVQAAKIIDAAADRLEGASRLDELVAQAWVARGWHNLSTSFAVRRHANDSTSEDIAAFGVWLEIAHSDNYSLDDAGQRLTLEMPEFAELAGRVLRGELEPRQIYCITPEWVAARVWDGDENPKEASSDFLLKWLQVVDMLRYPRIIPSRAWRADTRKHFESAAMRVLTAEVQFSSWSEYRERAPLRLARANGTHADAFSQQIAVMPTTVVARAIWLSQYYVEGLIQQDHATWKYADALVSILLGDIAEDEHHPALKEITGTIFSLAERHPEVMWMVLGAARSNPSIIVELLLNHRTTALACAVIAEWRLDSTAWDRSLVLRDKESARYTAFLDAVSVLGHFVRTKQLEASEVSALLSEMYSRVRRGASDTSKDAMLAALSDEISTFASDFQKAMVIALLNGSYALGINQPAFLAALRLIEIGKLAQPDLGRELVLAYIETIRRCDYNMTSERLTPSAAGILLTLAVQGGDELLKEFLCPVDVKEVLSSISLEENEFTVCGDLARRLRSHIRTLSRAIVGQSGEVPSTVPAALANTIYEGALQHTERGRVAAFAVRYELAPGGSSHEKDIAKDLGEALSILNKTDADKLLIELLQVDEPAFLAQLYKFAPQAMQATVRQHLVKLTPEKAARAFFLTDFQSRIDELLSIKAYDVAAAYMAAQPAPRSELKSSVALTRLQQRLRMAWGMQDWAVINTTAAPPEMNPVDLDAANDAIRFYKALSHLGRVDGDTALAESILVSLHNLHGQEPAYAFNLFAVKLLRLLGDNSFAVLQGPQLTAGQRLLQDADQLEDRYGLATSHADSFTTNKSILLLAIGRASLAEQLLRPMYLERITDTVAAYTAVAQLRLGQPDAAAAAIKKAETVLGQSSVLDSAKHYLNEGGAYLLPLPSSDVLSAEFDIQRALLAMHNMGPDEQAKLWSYPPSLKQFVLDHVRHAAASIVALVPMMKGISLDSCEDDINAVIRELLKARLSFLGWSTGDQSKGGYTALGNPGERDVLIQRDGSDLAVIEALVCARPVTQQFTIKDLTLHFQKLFAYSTCKVLVHLTYARISDLRGILQELRRISVHEVPPGFQYIKQRDISSSDSRPGGFEALYESNDGEVTVVFLVLNLHQEHQRNAAIVAATNSPRKSSRTNRKDDVGSG